MIVHRPSRLLVFAAAFSGVNALIAWSIGSLALAGGCGVVLALLALSHRQAQRRPIAVVETSVVHLRDRRMAVDLDASAIEGWKREGRTLRISLANGEVRVGPYWIEKPAVDLERVLDQTLGTPSQEAPARG